MFKKLEDNNEEKLINYWKDINILDKSIKNRENNECFVFYDGPATANGFPGLHHMMAKFLKDSICKYNTMKGYKVLRKIGWDTHGLPVEVEVEKQLGFKSKLDIEEYGIKQFNEKCKEAVWKNEKAFSNLTNKMGQFIDIDNPYVTYNNDYIETEWWILKKFYEEGLFYEGAKILPYCYRCGTGLASHEVAQGYKDVSVDTVIVPMKLKDEDTYLLVWTTTPWTLISNVALCVNENEDYVKVRYNDTNYILAQKLINKVFNEEVEVLDTFKGKDLEYTYYEQLIPSLNVDKDAFYVVCDDYVTTEDGTGIVHIAPAFGADDAKVGKKYDLPYLNPVGEDGNYKEGLWNGINVFDANLEIIKYLKENNKLFKKQRITHSYPHCWRCHNPLIYYSKPSFYLEVTKLKDKIIEENKKVNWYPSYVGEKRFGNWLENLNDWAISRNRYWGTPLPLYRCNHCDHEIMVGSKKELLDLAIDDISDIDLHRPYVDDLLLKCSKCSKEMQRVKDVIDCWFDSGSMPFAQYHYPFENKELFQSQFPADFIAEGIDQTRGWFYSLLVISTFVMGKAPYKNVLVNDLLLDAEGKKMSKSKGNIVEPFKIMEEYGADTVRFYLAYASPVWTPLKFDVNGLKEVHSKFFNPLRNTYNFFATYANIDKVDPKSFDIDYNDLELIDKWLLSKYNKLIKNVDESYKEYDLHKVVKFLSEFVSEDLSNWYIRRCRSRFWGNTMDNSKKSVYKTTYNVLLGLSKLVAPISPFISEEIYIALTNDVSVHLSDFEVVEEELINEEIETKMDLVRQLISLGRNAREDAKIKVRQPINKIILDGINKDKLKEFSSLIKEELNVKELVYENDLSKYMDFIIKPNFKEAGKVIGKDMKAYQEFLNTITLKDLDNNLEFNGISITKDLVDIKFIAKEGFNIAMEDNCFIVLDTTLTKDLLMEGLARELVSKVQNIRKERDFDIADRINLFYNSSLEFEEVLNKFNDYIKDETLTIDIIKKDDLKDLYTLNDIEVYLDVEKR